MKKTVDVWQVYILLCNDGSLYTGITTDLTRRLVEHNSSAKGAKYTKSRRPVELVYHETVDSRSTATKREYQLKKMKVSKKRLLIEGLG